MPLPISGQPDWSAALNDYLNAYFVGNVRTIPLQAAQSAPVNATGTPIVLTGLTVSVTSPGPSAVFLVEISADVSITAAATTNIINLYRNGTIISAPQLITQLANGSRLPGAKTWKVTGLAAGAHTFTARTYNLSGSGASTVNATHTVMTVTGYLAP